MEKKPFHAAYIDGLRAIAVLSVMAYHLNASWLPGGFAGVDVFFVISGFVVALSVSELGKIGLGQFLAYFYARRIVRITPVLVVVLIATFLASALFIPDAWLSSSNQKTGLYAFLGLSNFVLASNAGNYFAPLAEFNPFTHTWSLAVEEQFYLTFPWLFYLWLRDHRAASRWIFAAALAASFAGAIWLGRHSETYAFYMAWSRYWELAIGVLLFQIMSARGHSFGDASPRRPLLSILADVGLLIMIAGLVMARPQSAPFPACVLPVTGTAIVLFASHGRKWGLVYPLLTWRPLAFIGRISYSLYLWHWPVYVLFRWTAGLDKPVWQVSAIALTFALSALSYHFIEQPPRLAAKRLRKPVMISAGLALVALGFGVSNSIASNQSELSLSTVSRNHDMWYPMGAVSVSSPDGCAVADDMQDVKGGWLWTHQRVNCIKPAEWAHNLFVIGDSHAMAYTAMYRQLALRTGTTVYAYNNGGCPFISLQPANEQCEKYGEAAIADMLPRIQPGDVVFLASLRIPRMIEQSEIYGVDSARAQVASPEVAKGRADSVQRAIPLLRKITARGATVVFEGPTPNMLTIPFRCADWFNRGNPICRNGNNVPRALLEELRSPIMSAYQQLEQAVPGVTVWDPFPILCPRQECSAFHGKEPLFLDGDHLSGYANLMLLPHFTAFLESPIATAQR